MFSSPWTSVFHLDCTLIGNDTHLFPPFTCYKPWKMWKNLHKHWWHTQKNIVNAIQITMQCAATCLHVIRAFIICSFGLFLLLVLLLFFYHLTMAWWLIKDDKTAFSIRNWDACDGSVCVWGGVITMQQQHTHRLRDRDCAAFLLLAKDYIFTVCNSLCYDFLMIELR